MEALKARMVRKIVLVRPAVEAGESLGYLPGDLQEKLNPYLRPLLDAISEMVDYDCREIPDGARNHRGDSASLHARAHVEPSLHHIG
ncbi:MAG: PhoH family protein [Pirellulales bacterium]